MTYYERNREKVLEKAKLYYAQNKEKILERNNKYYLKFRDDIIENNKRTVKARADKKNELKEEERQKVKRTYIMIKKGKASIEI